MKFSDMLISLTGASSRARAIEELAWQANIYAQEAEKLVDALDKMTSSGVDLLAASAPALSVSPEKLQEIINYVNSRGGLLSLMRQGTTNNGDETEKQPSMPMPWQTSEDAEQQLQNIVDSLPQLHGVALGGANLNAVIEALSGDDIDVYGAMADALKHENITRWHVKVIVTLFSAWMGDHLITRTLPSPFDAVESMRHIVQQSEHHIGATRNTLIRAVVLKAMDDGHHVLPTLLECAQIAAKQLKEKSDAQS